VKLAVTAVLLLGTLMPAAAFADSVTDAKVQCQVEYDVRSDAGMSCLRGVELASRIGDSSRATDSCRGESEDRDRVRACQRGVALHARVTGASVPENQKSSFSYSWKPKEGTAQVDIGDYQLRVGDAEKQAEACMRQFEGSSTPPSCLSGFSAQHKPPAPGVPRYDPSAR
jgi:hypothetical protein